MALKQAFFNGGRLDATSSLLDEPRRVNAATALLERLNDYRDALERREFDLRSRASEPSCHEELRKAFEAEADGVRWCLRMLRIMVRTRR